MYTFLALNCFYISENLKHRLIDSFYILNIIAEYECKFIVLLIYMSSSLPLGSNRKSLLTSGVKNTNREYVVRLYEQIKEAEEKILETQIKAQIELQKQLDKMQLDMKRLQELSEKEKLELKKKFLSKELFKGLEEIPNFIRKKVG